MARKEKDPQQVLRIDGKNCFLEVMSSAFEIDKVRINFRQYDPNNGNKQSNAIDIYMGYKDFDYMYAGVLDGGGDLFNQMNQSQYGVTIYRGGREENGNVIARELKIQYGQKYPFILIAEQGAGSKNKMGGYSIIRGNNSAISKIQIPLTYNDLVHILISTNRALIAYQAAKMNETKTMFEMEKVKDLLKNLCYQTGVNGQTIDEIINRQPPRPAWMNNNNQNNNGNYNNNQNYDNQNNYQQNGGQYDNWQQQDNNGYNQQYNDNNYLPFN